MTQQYNGTTSRALLGDTILAVPDGHLAGNQNGGHPKDGVYELFHRANIPLMNDRGEYLRVRGDGAFAYAENFPELGPVAVLRPQVSPRYLEQGMLQACVTGTDCVIDAYIDGVKPSFVDKDGNPNPDILNVGNYIEVIREFLSSKNIDLAMVLGVRPSLTGFAFPVEDEVYTWDEVRRYPSHGHGYLHASGPFLGTEYTGFAEGLLSELGLYPKGFAIESSPGSTENLLRFAADGILDTVETGSGLKRVYARLAYPVTPETSILIVRKDAPDVVKEIIYGKGELIDRLTHARERMRKSNPFAFCFKLDYGNVSWDERGFRLPPELDRMRVS